MRDLDLATSLVAAAVDAVDVPVTVKMRLGWDDASRNAPEFAARAEAVGARAVTVHGRTRSQFYKGVADWSAIADVKREISVPLIVNGDIVDLASAQVALEASGADGIMIGRGAYGRPWIAAQIDAGLQGRVLPDPDMETRLDIALGHFRDALSFYGERLGLKMFRKHLASYIEAAPVPESPEARRAARAELCRLETPAEVEAALTRLWLSERRLAA
jgi:nifR3 family TIM-barrel protein